MSFQVPLRLVAFNLRKGAAFMVHNPLTPRVDEVTRKRDLAHKVLVVTEILHRHPSTETISVACRIIGSYAAPGREDSPPVYVIETFDYNDTVFLVGLVVNEDSWDDDNLGTGWEQPK